jgi:hypothetical protein
MRVTPIEERHERARVARELQEHELIGADSCAVAIEALDEHKPALVLLPAASPAGEPELLNRLRAAARGGIPTMKLPPPTSVNPRALADQIRQALGEEFRATAELLAVPGASPHLIAAARAAISWIKARRATWTAAPAAPAAPAEPATPAVPAAPTSPVVKPAVFAPALAGLAPALHGGDSDGDGGSSRQDSPYVLQTDGEVLEPAEPSAISRAIATVLESRESIALWLPRVAVLAAAALLAWALISYWPQLRGSVSSQKSDASTAPGSAPPSGAPAARGTAPGAADTSPESGVSGWIAVFSPFDVQVSEGARTIALDDRSRAMLPPGPHTLHFQNRALGYDETRTVQIKSTGTATVNLAPRTGISVTSTEPAEVLIDGTRVGETPLSAFKIDLGTHSVLVRSPTGERQITVTATSKPVQLDVDFSKP